MKKIVLGLGIVTVFAAGCLKNNDDDYKPCVVRTLEQDKPLMNKFATDSSITVTEDPSGILYQIIQPGSSTTPSKSSLIMAKYVGRNLSGVLFDSGQFDRPYALSGLISGWQIILPKIGVGGRMKMIIPSSLAYGCLGPTAAVYNQPLYFDVELISVQ